MWSKLMENLKGMVGEKRIDKMRYVEVLGLYDVKGKNGSKSALR